MGGYIAPPQSPRSPPAWPQNWPADTYISSTALLFIRRLDPLDSFPQQFLCVLVHAGQLLGDGVL